MDNKDGIIVVLNNMQGAKVLKKIITDAGYNLLDTCGSGSEVLRSVRRLEPLLVIINYDLPDTTGLEIAEIINEDNLCSVLVLVTQSQKQYFDKYRDVLDVSYLIKPFKKINFLNTVEILVKNRKKIKQLEYEVNSLKKRYEARKIVEKAKTFLMANEGMTEEEAHRFIQKRSMDTGTPITSVASEITKEYIE